MSPGWSEHSKRIWVAINVPHQEESVFVDSGVPLVCQSTVISLPAISGVDSILICLTATIPPTGDYVVSALHSLSEIFW